MKGETLESDLILNRSGENAREDGVQLGNGSKTYYHAVQPGGVENIVVELLKGGEGRIRS